MLSGSSPSRIAELRPWRSGLFAPVAPLTNAASEARAESVPSPPANGAAFSPGAYVTSSSAAATSSEASVETYFTGFSRGEPPGPLFVGRSPARGGGRDLFGPPPPRGRG